MSGSKVGKLITFLSGCTVSRRLVPDAHCPIDNELDMDTAKLSVQHNLFWLVFGAIVYA